MQTQKMEQEIFEVRREIESKNGTIFMKNQEIEQLNLTIKDMQQ